MSRLLQIGWAEQKSLRADAQHCHFAQIQAVFHIAGFVCALFIIMVADHSDHLAACLLLV